MYYIVSIMKNDVKKGVKPLRQKALPAELRRALREAREKRGWSQRDLASRLSVGQRHISGIESGKIVPRYDTLLELVRALDRDLLMVPRALVPVVQSLVRDYLAKRADVNPEREFFLLTVLGADLPGALVIAPLEGQAQGPKAHHDHDDEHDHAHDSEQPLRFSLAGVQLKFSAVMEASGGLTIPVDGMGGSWIVKLPSARYEAVPENEFAMMELARRVGISVPENKLVDIASIKGLPEQAHTVEGRALAVKRFDRKPGGEPVHMEEFAQVFLEISDDKYKRHSCANIAAVLWAEIGEDAILEFVRRLVFSVLIGNADMHLKNWSLLYPNRRTPVLSPGYDFVATLPYIPNDKLVARR